MIIELRLLSLYFAASRTVSGRIADSEVMVKQPPGQLFSSPVSAFGCPETALWERCFATPQSPDGTRKCRGLQCHAADSSG